MFSHRFSRAINGIAVLTLLALVFVAGLSFVRATDNNQISLVSQIGGATRGTAVVGRYAYVGVGPSLVVVDVANAVAPIILNETGPLSATNLPESIIEDITFDSRYLYVAAGPAGLFIVDVGDTNNPTTPTVVGNYYISNGYANAVAVSGNTAVIANDVDGLVALNIATKTAPLLLSTHVTDDAAMDVILGSGLGNELYAFTAAGTAGMQSFEILPVADGTPAATIALSDFAEGLTYDLSQSYIYVADTGGGVGIINITNPEVPTYVGAVATPGLAMGVGSFGNYLFVADDLDGMRTFDITNPAVPVDKGSLPLFGIATAIATGNNRVYVSAEYGGLRIVDFGNINAVAELGAFTSLGEMYGADMPATGSTLYGADGYPGLASVDVSDRANPAINGEAFTNEYATNTAVSGNYNFVANSFGGLSVVDISDPAAPTAVADLLTNDEAVDIVIDGSYAYLADSSGGLFIADISEPLTPTLAAVVDSTSTPALPYAIGLDIAGTNAYIAADLDGLYVVDISDPLNAAVSDNTALSAGSAQAVDVVGNYAYVAADSGGLIILNATTLAEVGVVNDTSTTALPLALDVVAVGNYALVAAGADGVYAVDVTDPAAPAVLGYYNTAGFASRIFVQGAIYAADVEGGLYVLNFNDFNFGISDLAVNVTDGLTTAVAGTNHTYTVTLSNLGPSDVMNAGVSDSFPADFGSVSWTCTAVTGSLCDSASGSGDLNAATVDLHAGGTATIIANGTIASDATGTLANTATITTPVGITDGTAGNDSATDTTTITAETDLSVSVTDTPDPVLPGGTLTYQATVTNNGPSDMTTAGEVSIVIPASPNATFSDATPGCTNNAGTVTCAVSPLALGANTSVTVTMSVGSSVTSSLSGSATVSSTDTDPTVSNDTVNVTTGIKTADLSLAISNSPQPVVAGDLVTYTITIDNLGPDGATNVTVSDTLPAELTFDSGSIACSAVSQVVTCNLDSIASGNNKQATITALVGSDVTAAFDNTASVSASEYDDDAANDTDTATATVSLVGDLAITVSDGADASTAGAPISYNIVVTNNGPSDISGATVTDNFPATITGVTWTCAGTGGAACASASGSGNISLLVDVPVGGEITITAEGTISNSATNLLVNTATVAVPSSATDPDLSNNTDIDTNGLGQTADLQMTVSQDPLDLKPGDLFTYTLSVTNNGPSDAGNVRISSILPAATTIAFESSDVCTVTSGQLNCALGNIANASNGQVTVVFRAQAPGDQTMTFVLAALNDSDTTDNIKQITTTVGNYELFLPFVIK